ncbi:MAG TPA: hypothetical protein P5079_10455 [Elusimicrobiota bacterium]|nr:hypothetical protein [Elusimicrobiota bacterium]
MARIRQFVSFFLSFGAAFFAVAVGQAGLGLSTTFVDVVMDELKTGQGYVSGQRDFRPFTVTNHSSKPVKVVIEPEISPQGVLEGYEPIPSIAWLKVTPQRLSLKPGETKTAHLRLDIPKGEQWKQRHFQVNLRTRTDEGTVAVGLESRLRFSVEAVRPESATPRTAALSKLEQVRFEPQELYFNKVPAGKEMRLTDDRRSILKIANKGNTPVRLSLRPGYFQSAGLPEGYVSTPNPDFLEVAPRSVEVPADSAVTVNLQVRIPPGTVHYGKKYAFLLRASVDDGITEPVLARVYVRVRG